MLSSFAVVLVEYMYLELNWTYDIRKVSNAAIAIN